MPAIVVHLSEPTLTQFLDLLLDVVCVVDPDGHFQYVSAACERVFGFTRDEMVGKTVQDLVHPDDRERTLESADQIMAGTESTQFENRYLRGDGTVAHIMWSARWSEEGQVRIGVARDITRRKQAELMQAALLVISQAAHRTHDLGDLLDQIRHIVAPLVSCKGFHVGLRGDRSERWSSFLYRGEPEPGAALPESLEGFCERVCTEGLTLALSPGSPATVANVGEQYQWLGIPLAIEEDMMGALVVVGGTRGARLREDDRQLLEFVADQVAIAISQQRMLARLQQRAQYDDLTGLPNRVLLDDRLQKAISHAERESSIIALLFVDMDDFKRVNDILGHAAGDHLLQLTARRLEDSVRASDTVARLGGDEFIIVLEGLTTPDHAQTLVDKIHSAFSRPFELEGQQLAAPLSIGMALYPRDGATATELLRHADKRMYATKNRDG